MKNIHLTPTDKPSRIGYYTDLIDTQLYILSNNNKIGDYKPNWKPQNIYITSDEEIKEGDWYLVELFKITGESDGFHIEKCTKLDDVWCNNFDVISTRHKDNCKKIILTTDQDLIKDGVQAIDNEFLEWFVKNPSCEEVEVDKGYRGVNLFNYKIIIPQEEPKTNLERLSFPELVEEFAEYYKSIPLIEEPKQTRTIVDELKAYFENTPEDKIQSDWDETCKRTEGIESPTVSEFMEAQKQFMEQEIIRAAEQRYPFEVGYSVSDENIRIGELQDAYIEGAKEQAGRMYSEKEVLDLLLTWKYTEHGLLSTKEWFEQYKKK